MQNKLHAVRRVCMSSSTDVRRHVASLVDETFLFFCIHMQSNIGICSKEDLDPPVYTASVIVFFDLCSLDFCLLLLFVFYLQIQLRRLSPRSSSCNRL